MAATLWCCMTEAQAGPVAVPGAVQGTGQGKEQGTARGAAPGGAWGRRTVIGVPFAFMVLFFSLPFLVVLRISVAEPDAGGLGELLSWTDGALRLHLKLANYRYLVSDAFYLSHYLSSLGYAALNTAVCLLVGYPFAYFMSRARRDLRPVLVLLVSLPFWISYLLRIYAWKGLLDDHGVVNQILLWLHWADAPLHMLYTPFSMTVGMAYCYLPFMILPLYGTLVKADPRLLEAAADLGAGPWRIFWLVTVPLSRAGVVAGCMLVFIPSVGEYVIPELLGGPQTRMIARVLWNEYFQNLDWPMASAVAVSMMAILLVPLLWLQSAQRGAGQGGGSASGPAAVAGRA
jgi:putrescine transport system permease protein